MTGVNTLCEFCGKPITQADRKKFCSDECSYREHQRLKAEAKHKRVLDRRAAAPMVMCKCGCEREFKQVNPRQKFYSEKCKDLYFKKAHKPMRVCPSCGTSFVQAHNKVYCGPKCKPTAVIRTITCKCCGKIFQGKKDTRYCSPECKGARVAEKLAAQRPTPKQKGEGVSDFPGAKAMQARVSAGIRRVVIAAWQRADPVQRLALEFRNPDIDFQSVIY